MAESTLWWLLAGAAVAIELLTGTFYLLMLGIGMVAGAIAAHVGFATPGQLVAAAVFGGGAVAIWHVVRKRHFAAGDGDNANLHLDVGESVHVEAWTAENTSTVRYRGATWTVVPAGGIPQGTGAHRVREISGSRLVVEKI